MDREVVGTIAWQVCDFDSDRNIPKNVDERSKQQAHAFKCVLRNAVSLIKLIGTDNTIPDIVKNAISKGYIHACAESYDVAGEIAKFSSDDPEEVELYETYFKHGFEAGILTHMPIDTFMRKVLGYVNYQPVIITEDEL